MSDGDSPRIGSVEWRDLTVPDAEAVQQFYCDVVGWDSARQSMGDYDDFNMLRPGTEDCVGGICHARGTNANVPAQWLIYIRVESVATSAARCVERGGKVLDGPRKLGAEDFCVIQDPAGGRLLVERVAAKDGHTDLVR